MSNDEEKSTLSTPLDRETYLKMRDLYDKAELEVSGRYDQWILTLSGGALALSITFIEKIAPHPDIDTLFWLKVSWSCLILSLLTALISLVTSQSAIRENRKEIDSAKEAKENHPRRFSSITNGLNWGSLILFIWGTIFLCVFSFKNLNVNITDEEKKNVQEVTSKNVAKQTNKERICSATATA